MLRARSQLRLKPQRLTRIFICLVPCSTFETQLLGLLLSMRFCQPQPTPNECIISLITLITAAVHRKEIELDCTRTLVSEVRVNLTLKTLFLSMSRVFTRECATAFNADHQNFNETDLTCRCAMETRDRITRIGTDEVKSYCQMQLADFSCR